MDNQSSTGGSIVAVKKNGEDLVDEQIDERILRLLGLEYIFDIDYDTYTSLLKEKMVAARMAKTQIPTEEAELLTNEYKKIRGKKGRFKVKKITADSFKKGSAVGVNLGKQKALIGKSQLALPPADKMTGGSDIKEIIDALAEIIKSLTNQNKLAKDSAEKSRIAGEAGQRGAKESGLEKGFKFAIKAAEKVIAPIKSLLDRIIDFFVAIFVGRALIKLLDWFSKEENQGKIKAIGRFLGDNWPKLLALYIMFGTGLGKFVGFLTKIVIGGSIKLAIAVARLLAKAGVGKAAGAAKFLGGKYGKLLGAGLEVAATVGTTMAVSKGIENFGGIGGEEQKTQGYSGGGFVIPKFAGGGLNFKGMMGGAGMGSMFGPLGMLLGAGLGSGKIQETVSGLIGGQKGVDKVPAMLSDGEFVMSRGAVQKYGVDTLEGMNAAGGGTNQPKIVSGTTYAAGGGMMGMRSGGSTRTRFPGDPDSGRGDPTYKSTYKPPLEDDIRSAQSRLDSSQAKRNTNINNSITPWWQKINPFINKPYNLQLPSHDASERNYNMPGYNRDKWSDLNNFRTNTQKYKQKAPYAPNSGSHYIKPGTTAPLMVKGGGTRYGSGGLAMIGGGRFAQTPGGGFGRGGFLRKLGELGVPGTGPVMAPLSSGQKDIYGNQQTGANYQNKLFGMNMGSPFGHQDGASGQYDSVEKSRYEKMSGRKFVPTLYGDYRGTAEGMPGLTRPTRVPRQSIIPTDPKKENDKFIGESFRDFGKNVKNIKSSSKKQEEMMRELGVKPDGYVNMRGQKLNIGPQSKAMPIEPPSKSTVKVVYTTASGGIPKLNTSSGASPSVPSFSATHPNTQSRRRSAAVLGVA